jgi:apolipoprotein N-acyltransferase
VPLHTNVFTIEQSKIVRIGLATISGVLLGLSFPPSPFYSLAYIAFIPFFFLFTYFRSYTQITRYAYLFLFFFHLLTVYWTGGFATAKDLWMMAAGTAVLLIHPVFYIPFILFSFFVKKKLGDGLGLISFGLLWTSFEYLHSLGEYSFPWLTVGNSQAYDLPQIQIIDYISIYGLSLIILAFNALAFYALWKYSHGNWKLRSASFLFSFSMLILLYFGPKAYGRLVVGTENLQKTDSIRIAIIQPNFNPWEKWSEGVSNKRDLYARQFDEYLETTRELSREHPDIVFWPETAIPFHILLPRYSPDLRELLSLSDSLQLPILTGLPTAQYFDASTAPATAERVGASNIFVESYNSTVLIQPHGSIGPIHRKTILVPFAERIPYAESFRFLIEPLKWNVGISSWGKGNDTIVYSFPTRAKHQARFSAMICYESAYPNYVRQFVKRGAQFLVVLTNDSWWGNTSGAYQHASFASLRAVETRRWVVQCANGGISLVADPSGRIRTSAGLFTRARFVAEIGLRSDETFYVKYGDVVARLCLIASIVFVAISVLQSRIIRGR